MTSRATCQRARLLRLRTIEHRLAAQAVARADAALSDLEAIAGRLDALRGSLKIAAGRQDGEAVKAMAEMQARLDRAATEMTAPIAAAHADRIRHNARRLQARQREDGASRLLDRAMQTDGVMAERRADAHRAPSRPRRMQEEKR